MVAIFLHNHSISVGQANGIQIAALTKVKNERKKAHTTFNLFAQKNKIKKINNKNKNEMNEAEKEGTATINYCNEKKRYETKRKTKRSESKQSGSQVI